MAARPSLMPSSREPLCMEFLGLTYTVQAADGSGKTILADASGVVNPGDVLAIMGPSGAGKTTLLSLLAGRQRPTQGCVLLNRRPLDKATRRAISVVTQNDVLFQHLTVRETLTYSALLRLPSAMTRAEKLQRVDHVIDALRLTKVRDSIVGNQFVRGISGGEKRRVSIGVELLSNPGILLLDEPTTGLDSSTALSLVETLKSIAISDDVAVALTIHQPGTNIFMKFDSLMLVAHGRLAYFGSRADSVEFFQRAGHPVPNNYNPADYYMDVLNEPTKRDQILAYAQRELPAPIACSVCTHPAAYPTANLPGQNNHQQQQQQQQTPPMICSRCVSQAGAPSPASSQRSLNEEDDEERTWPTTSLQQIMILAHRSFTQTKGEIVSLLPWLQTCVVLLVVSLVWNQMSYTEAQIQDRRGFIFFMCAYWGFQMMSLAASTFPIDRAVLQKERLSGSYRLSSYVIAKSISELPLVLIQPTVFHAICYWATGLRGGVYYVISWAIHMLLCLAAHSIGLFIGASIMDFKKAVTVASSSMMFCMLTGGFYAQQFPSWIKWIQWTSFVKYGYDAQVYNEFHAKTFSCLTPSSQYEACNSQSFLEGEDVLEKYNTETRLWLLLLVLALFTFFFRFLAYLSLRTLHSTSRGIQKGPKPKSFAASRAGSRRESAMAKV